MPPQNRVINRVSSLIFATAIFISSLGIFIVWKARALEVSPQKLITAFLNNLYLPHVNLCPVGEVSGENILHIFYQFLLIALAMAVFIFFLVQTFYKKRGKISPLSLTLTVRWIFIFSLILITGLQQIKRQEHFVIEFRRFNGKTIPEKNRLLFGNLYKLTEDSRKALPGRHNAVFLTDEDLGEDPWMTYHRMLAYHLFPNVSFRYRLNAPDDCLLLFFKKKDVEKLLEGYEIVVISNDKNYILAVKKGALR